MTYNIFDKKTGSEARANKDLTQELHEPVIEKFKRRKIYMRFKDNFG